MTFEERMLEKRLLKKRLITSAGCWEYNGATTWDGYGILRFNIGFIKAHRASMMLYRPNEYQSFLQINHKCYNSKCFNPEHLYFGTQRENVMDTIRAGHWKNPNPKVL